MLHAACIICPSALQIVRFVLELMPIYLVALQKKDTTSLRQAASLRHFLFVRPPATEAAYSS